MATRSSRVPYLLAVIWLLFTVSLASWWLSVGLTLTGRREMFLWEGGVFILVLIAGGLTIVLAIRREQRRREAVETFFMSFTHDIKTSLARVQLQAEGLREDFPDAAARDSVDRLLADTLRLQIQLENSLFVAQPDGRLLRERVDVKAACERLAADWPGLAVHVTGHGHVLADARALDAVLRNLLQNSVVHGGASRVDVAIDPAAEGRVQVALADDGRGVDRDRLSRLGELGARPSETSATGVGLYVCRRLVGRMDGTLTFEGAAVGSHGLRVVVQLPGATR